APRSPAARTPLFERIGRRIYPTPAVQALSVKIDRIFAAVERATERLLETAPEARHLGHQVSGGQAGSNAVEHAARCGHLSCQTCPRPFAATRSMDGHSSLDGSGRPLTSPDLDQARHPTRRG